MPRSPLAHRSALGLLLTLSLTACANQNGPATLPTSPEAAATADAQSLSAFTLTLTNPQARGVAAQGLSPQATLLPLFPLDTLDLRPAQSGVHDDEKSNRRYLWFKFDVKNKSKVTLRNLTLTAYHQAGVGIGGSAITGLLKPGGGAYRNDLVASNIRPGDFLTSLPGSLTGYGFTALTTDEAKKVEKQARKFGLLGGGDDVLEYGFTVLNAGNGSAVLRPGEQGALTLVVKLPLVDANAPAQFSMSLLLTQMDRSRVTRLVGESTASAAARAEGVGAQEVALIGRDADTAPGKAETIRIPNVRLTSGSKPVYLVDNEPDPAGCLGGVSPNSLGGQALSGQTLGAQGAAAGPMITLLTDDAMVADKTKLLPLLKAKGVVATTAVVSAQMTNPDPSFLSLEGVRELKQAGWEIVSHTMTHPDLTTLSDEDLVRELRDSKKELALFGFNTTSLVYPYGQQDARVRAVACKYYRHAVLAWGEGNTLPLNTRYQIGRYALGAYANGSWATLDFYKATVDQAIKNKDWLVFMLHPGDPLHTDIQQEYVSQTIDYIKSKGVPIVTMGEALRRIEAP